jgi:hypothetical protein
MIKGKDMKQLIYIRTVDGKIHKEILDAYEQQIEDVKELNYEVSRVIVTVALKEDNYNGVKIKSASFNIIDLIEIGDLVNGELVTGIDDYGIFTANMRLKGFRESDIKTILTHEQIEAHSYKLEG